MALGVIFDMDGVLVDSYQAHYQSWAQAAAGYGLKLTEADFARIFGRTSRDIIRTFWAERFSDAQVAEFDAAKEVAYRDIIGTSFPEMDGAGDLVRALHGAGFRLAIGSSGPRLNVELVRRCLHGGEFLAAAVTGTDVRHGKPDPEVFLLAAAKLGLPPAQCAVIEDAPAGIEAARRADMTAIALTGTATREVLGVRAHKVVDSLRELSPSLIKEFIAQRQPQI